MCSISFDSICELVFIYEDLRAAMIFFPIEVKPIMQWQPSAVAASFAMCVCLFILSKSE